MSRKHTWLPIAASFLFLFSVSAVGFEFVSKQLQSPAVSHQSPASQKPSGSEAAHVKQWVVVANSGTPYTVVAIGGSSAHGWDDSKQSGGYLARAFKSVNATEHVDYHFINLSKVGYGPAQYDNSQFSGIFVDDPQLLQLFSEFKPQMLVISFGMLDDVNDKTPILQFEKSLRDEIQTALANHIVVLVVTPPPVVASETNLQATVDTYLKAQADVVASLQNPNIYTIDLHQQMNSYIAAHHQSITRYKADGWHPNAAGHALAGQLLAQDIEKIFVRI